MLNFKEKLIELRKEKNMTQDDLAKKMIYRNTLDDVEKETADKFNKHLKLKQNANEVQTEGEFSA